MNFFKTSKAQGTIEYLVIIAIVIVISLVVVSIIINQTSSVSTTNQNATNLAWQTKEIQVLTLVTDSQGQGIILLTSNLTDRITIDNIELDDMPNSTSKQLFLGSTQKISLSNLTACAGQTQKYNIKLNYTTSQGLQKTITGNFYADCINNALTINSLNLSTGDANLITNTSIATGYLSLTNSEAISTSELDNLEDGTNVGNYLEITSTQINLRTN